MALPPEPIDDVIAQADAAVLAEVTRVVKQDPEKPTTGFDPQATSVPSQAARQVVELKVSASIFGTVKAGTLVQAVKPAGAYALRAGNQGPFVLLNVGDSTQIVGRYGPDSWPEAAVRAAATRHQKR